MTSGLLLGPPHNPFFRALLGRARQTERTILTALRLRGVPVVVNAKVPRLQTRSNKL